MKTYLSIFLSLLLCSCSVGGNKENLKKAYRLLNTDPDSAMILLEQTDRSSFSKKEQAQYALYYSIAQDKSGLDVDKDTLLRVAYDYYKDKPEDSLYAKSNYYMGLYYQEVDSSKRATDCFYNAIHASEKQHDLYTQYLASNRLSWSIYHLAPEEGLFYAKEACRLYDELGETNIRNKVYLILRVEECFRWLGKSDSVSLYLAEALRLSTKTKDKNLMASTLYSIAKEYRMLSMPDSALYFTKLAWNNTEKKEPTDYYQLALCFLEVDSLDQAENNLTQILQIPSSVHTKYGAYDHLLEISLKKKDYQHIEKYSDSAQYMLKKIYQSNASDNQNYRKDNAELNNTNEKLNSDLISARYRFIIYILISLFVIVCSIFFFYLYRISSGRKADMLLEQEKHRHEMEEFELTKQKEILEMQHKEKQEKHRIMLENTEKQLGLMKRYVISIMQFEQNLDKIKKEKTVSSLSNDDWVKIELFLNDSARGFMSSFRESFPNLKESDFQLCMLLKLDFSNQELTHFYGIKHESIKHRLLMLKSKLGIENSPFSAREYIKMWLKDEIIE